MINRIRSRRNQKGFFTIWVLGLCLGLLFIGGLTNDFWRAFSARRDLASVADGAAVAGTRAIDLSVFRDPTTNGRVQLIAGNGKGSAFDEACAYLQSELRQGEVDCVKQIEIRNDEKGFPRVVHISLDRDVPFIALRFLPSPNAQFQKSERIHAASEAVAEYLP
jgi:hypothetical protein